MGTVFLILQLPRLLLQLVTVMGETHFVADTEFVEIYWNRRPEERERNFFNDDLGPVQGTATFREAEL